MKNPKTLFMAAVVLFPLVASCIPASAASAAGRAHPYLFFSSKDVPAIRARVDSPPFADRKALLLGAVNALLEQPPSPIQRVNQGNCGLLAFAYVATGDARYADRAIAEALASAAVEVWDAGHSFNRGADLMTSERGLGLALVYDWCFDRLSEEQRATIREALIEKELKPYYSSVNPSLEPNWWVYEPVNNWRGVCHGAASVAALALYDESGLARTCAELARKHVHAALDEHILADSGGHEGVEYNNYGVEYSLIGAAALQRFYGGYEELLRNLADARLGNYWSIYMDAPDGHFANIGRMVYVWSQFLYAKDGDPAGGPSSMRSALFDSLVPGGDPLLRWAADNGGQRFYWRGANPFYFIWRRSNAPSLLRRPIPPLQDAVLFRGAGHAILQSDQLWLAYSGGAAFNRGDVGAFVLDANVGGEWERMIWIQPTIKKGMMGSALQSTYLINGEGQTTGPSTLKKPAHYLRFGSATGFHYLANDIRPLYANPALERLVRHLVMVRGRYLVLLDDIAATGAVNLETRFQTVDSAAISLDRDSARIAGKSCDLHLVMADAGFALDQGTAGALRFVSASGKASDATLVTVLYPTRPGGEPPSVEWKNGTVTVSHGGERDVLAFSRAASGWQLTGVNGQSASGIADGEKRNLIPVREGRTDAGEVPAWLLSTGGVTE